MIQFKRFAVFSIVALAFSSCLKEDEVTIQYPDQLFRPLSFSAGVDGAAVSFNWVPIKNASYLLEVSRDSFLFERELQTLPIDGKSTYVLEDLWSQTRYSARIKAVSREPGIKDSEYQRLTFTTGVENLFFALRPEDIFPDKLVLAWEPEKVVSRIDVLADGTLIKSAALTEEDIAIGSHTIAGLTPDTEYVFRIYQDERLRGTLTATTLAAE